jgi:hypothetical protein
MIVRVKQLSSMVFLQKSKNEEGNLSKLLPVESSTVDSVSRRIVPLRIQ